MTTAPVLDHKPSISIPLDPLQRAAAEAPVGPVIIMGGPGSGKTHSLLGRIGALLESGATPSTITCLTFSSRNADQIRQKIGEIAPDEALLRRLFIGTFHHYASTFLRQDGARLIGRSPQFTLWDQDQAQNVISSFAEQDPSRITLTGNEIKKFLDWHKLNRARWVQEKIAADEEFWYKLLEIYEATKLSQNTMDLDDLTPMSVRAMEADPRIRTIWSQVRSRHLLIDEFQDITPIQYRLIELMTGPTRSVTIATDPNQSIYGWRGADNSLLGQFRISHPNAEVHLLRLNHRSTTTLVNLATTLTGDESMSGLTNDYQKAIRPAGALPQIIEAQGDEKKADQARSGHSPEEGGHREA